MGTVLKASHNNIPRNTRIVLAAACLGLLAVSFPLPASVLLLYEDAYMSTEDCHGIELALTEAGITHDMLDIGKSSLEISHLADHAVAVACHVQLEPADAELLSDWVAIGGGLLATGLSGVGLEPALGLDAVDEDDLSGEPPTKVEFVTDHAVTTGSWWEGEITSTPPMPAEEMPTIMQHYYFDGYWPTWIAQPGDATVVGNWRDEGSPTAVTVHEFESGRSVYSGALMGSYVGGDWPRSWRTVIVSAIEWLSKQRPLVELGYWPDAHRGAFAWTGDTESRAMQTAVPSLLDLFSRLGLEQFGTFYVLGRADDDAPGTEGAQENPEIIDAIVRAGSEVAGHGDVHTSFEGLSYEQQRDRLEDMQEIINPLLQPHGQQVTGFRAPFVEHDTTTWRVLADLGLGHDAGELDIWSQTTLPHSTGDILQLPPIMPMDWHLFEKHELSPETAEQIWLDKFDYVMARRGLFSWLHHPWIIEDHLALVENILSAAISRGDVWMARQDDIATWWKQREDIELVSETFVDGSVGVLIVNEGDTPVDGVSVWVRVPSGSDRSWAAFVDGQQVPLLERSHAGALFRVAVIPKMEAEEERYLELATEIQIFQDRFEFRESH